MKTTTLGGNFRLLTRPLLLFMKIYILLFTLVSFGLGSEKGFSQNERIRFDSHVSLTVEEILDEIKKQTNYNFIYRSDLFANSPKMVVNKGRVKVGELLERCAETSDFEYSFTENNAIVLRKSPPQAKEVVQYSVSGTVLDNDNIPLSGANIVEQGTANGVTADFDGNFQLNVADENAILEVSYIGYATKNISVNGQTDIQIILEASAAGLEEVVVVGYGTARKKDITGSVISKNLEDSPESKLPTTNVLQNLRGMSGVNVGIQNSPGTNPSLIVRGQNSINGSNAPLIILDGIVYLGNLTNINPQDISKIDVLKDASATAVYGSRAANGVIVITTKKGKIGKPKITYATSFGFNRWGNKFNLMETDQWLEKFADQRELDSTGDVVFDDLTPTENLRQGVNTDWLDLISRQGFFQDHQIDVSGSSDKINYYFSGGYNESEGVIIGDEFNRISISSKLDADITDWLKVGVSGSYNRTDYSGIQANVFDAITMGPLGYPYRYEGMPYDVSSNSETLLERWPLGQSKQSPLWGTDGTVDDVDERNFFRFAGYANVEIPQIKGLSYKINYAAYTEDRTQDRFYHEDYYIPEVATNFYIERYEDAEIQKLLAQANGYNYKRVDFNYVFDNIINYNRRFGDHYLGATLVATRDFTSIKDNRVSGNDFSAAGSTSLGVDGLQKSNNIIYSKNITERANVGYLARLNYAFKDRYNLTGSVRRDGASVFGANRKWGTFSSLGVAWTVSEENFLKGNETLNYLKLKASYGQNGNQGVGPYSTLSAAISGQDGGIRYEFGDNPSQVLYGIAVQNLANSELGWEKTTSFNGGFSSAWFNNRAFLDLDFYFSKTTDQIFTRNIPIMTGFSSIITSLGQVDNRGIEINLRTINIDKENLSWQSDFSFWQNRNIVQSLYGDDNDGDGVEDDDVANSLFIGESLGAIYGYEYVGVVQEDDTAYIENNSAVPGDPMFRDLNGDGVIDADNDRTILGFRKPNFRMNFSNTLTYKNFTLYALLTGVFGGGKDNFYVRENPFRNSFRSRFDTNEVVHDWWTPENQSEEYLRSNYVGNRYLGLQSRGFVRIQDVSLSYAMPQTVLDNLGVSNLEIFAGAKNLYVFTDWFGGGDPEFENGIRPFDNINPVPTTITLGVKTSF
ncbi:SusC/RagA family TonB-linked outer membrane protein [Euzebyella saccharophila]|uniref:SusC/RagA family TonB-linked outer membrane protein n=1 Tax=Euzebyella saccharophila TaxID=679664 RepID=A0ABV8JUM6_9FLAO|nr:SusC/RagA family TonB-linked outer membrane protein [Euzebyella saccharophila]